MRGREADAWLTSTVAFDRFHGDDHAAEHNAQFARAKARALELRMQRDKEEGYEKRARVYRPGR